MGLLFRLSNVLVLPFWALMILLPRWRWTTRVIRSPLVSGAPAALYAALVLPRLAAIGRWIYLDSQERRVSAWVLAPVLFLTLMLGPAGLLFYLVIRSVVAVSPVRTKSPLQSSI